MAGRSPTTGQRSVIVVELIGEQYIHNLADDQDALHDGRHVGTEQSQQFPQDHLLARGMWVSGQRSYSGSGESFERAGVGGGLMDETTSPEKNRRIPLCFPVVR